MTKDEALAMDLALEALEQGIDGQTSIQMDKAITAIKQARSAPVQEPVQEPVATLWQHGETGRTRITMPGDITDCDARWFKAADLYTTPPAQPAPAPGYCKHCKQYSIEEPLPAAQRQWVGLTDEEVGDLSDFAYANDEEFVRNVEAKLKQKNGGVV